MSLPSLPPLPTKNTNSTPQQDTHPDLHNNANDHINKIVTELRDFDRHEAVGDLYVGTHGQNNPGGGTSGLRITRDGVITSAVLPPSGVSTTSINLLRAGTPGDVGGIFIRFARTSADTIAGAIKVATGGGVDYLKTSDPRLKTVTGEVTDAAVRVKALAASVFRGHWNEDPEQTPHDLISAHDIEDHAPYAVVGERDAQDADGEIDPMLVDYTKLIPILTKALGEALERIDALEAGT